MERALANAKAISLLQQYGDRVTVVSSANALQPDGQNDNGWDQGLVFFDTHRSWLQPPGYVTRMFSDSNLGTVVHAETDNPSLAVSAQFDGSKLVLHVRTSPRRPSRPRSRSPASHRRAGRPGSPASAAHAPNRTTPATSTR